MASSGEYRLKDGRAVVLRTAGPEDTSAIARLFAELSRESFRSRFQAGQPAPAVVERFARVDLPAVVSVVAVAADDPGRLAAEARYVLMGDGTAELAFTVLDSYQGAGLGRLLLNVLMERARESGLKRLRAVISLTNTPMLHLLAPYGWVLAEPADDYSTACLEISTIGGMPGWPTASAGRRVLVEQRGWFGNERVEALRSAGYDVRQCTGPRRQAGRACPLLTSGHCRLVEQADLIVPMFSSEDEDYAPVLEYHRRHWPGRLAE